MSVPLRLLCVCVCVSERAAELQQTVQELHKALDITRQAREEDQHALQQEVEERDALVQSFSSKNQRLHRLLQVSHTHTHTPNVEVKQTGCGLNICPPGSGGGSGGVGEEDGGGSEGERKGG